MKQTILHINIHGNQSDVSSHHQEKPGCRCLPAGEARSYVAPVKGGRVLELLLQLGGKSLALLANSNNHKITFLLRPSHTKRQVFFPSSAPSSFFLLPSAAHNSEHYMMAAPKHRSGFSERDRTPPPVHFM